MACRSASGLCSSDARSMIDMLPPWVGLRWAPAALGQRPANGLGANCSVALAAELALQLLAQTQRRLHLRLGPERGPHAEEVGRGGDVMHAYDVGSGVHAVSHRGQGAAQALTRGPTCDRADEVL